MRPTDISISRCIGLWIAEGDKKTKSEITFTNNSSELIGLFYSTLKRLFRSDKFRLYVYSKENNKRLIRHGIKEVRFYIDKRSNRPYYILRLASKKFVLKWHRIVSSFSKKKKYYPYILQGFFAGEGNIKEGSHYSRQVRIAQKNPVPLIDAILNYFKISYKFSKRERAYVISGRSNWEKLNKMNIATLHPDKAKRFLRVYSEFREWHYNHNYIRNNLLQMLNEPKTSAELAQIFKRKQSRIQDVVTDMKKQGLINNFRVESKDYWILNKTSKIIISEIKAQILNEINEPKRTYQISMGLNRDHRSTKRRLLELENLGLVKRNKLNWERINTDKEVLVI